MLHHQHHMLHDSNKVCVRVNVCVRVCIEYLGNEDICDWSAGQSDGGCQMVAVVLCCTLHRKSHWHIKVLLTCNSCRVTNVFLDASWLNAHLDIEHIDLLLLCWQPPARQTDRQTDNQTGRQAARLLLQFPHAFF